jgi:hypothetical protein
MLAPDEIDARGDGLVVNGFGFAVQADSPRSDDVRFTDLSTRWKHVFAGVNWPPGVNPAIVQADNASRCICAPRSRGVLRIRHFATVLHLLWLGSRGR